MLTLDHTTLFYFSLRDQASKFSQGGLVNDWAIQVSLNTKPSSKPSTASGRSASRVPALTNGSSRSSRAPTTSNRSALNNQIKINNPGDDSIVIVNGGLFDRDETRGEEREAAVKSPPKGKQRLTSSVSNTVYNSLISAYSICAIQALVKVEHSPQPKGTKPRKKPTNDDLPKVCHEGGTWRKQVIPTLF